MEFTRWPTVQTRHSSTCHGSKSSTPLVLLCLTVYVDENEEDAYKLKQQLDDMIPLENAKKQLSKAIGLDISEWKLDEVIPSLPDYETLSKKVKISI